MRMFGSLKRAGDKSQLPKGGSRHIFTFIEVSRLQKG